MKHKIMQRMTEAKDIKENACIGNFCGELQRFFFFFKVPKMEFFIKLIFEI